MQPAWTVATRPPAPHRTPVVARTTAAPTTDARGSSRRQPDATSCLELMPRALPSIQQTSRLRSGTRRSGSRPATTPRSNRLWTDHAGAHDRGVVRVRELMVGPGALGEVVVRVGVHGR